MEHKEAIPNAEVSQESYKREIDFLAPALYPDLSASDTRKLKSIIETVLLDPPEVDTQKHKTPERLQAVEESRQGVVTLRDDLRSRLDAYKTILDETSPDDSDVLEYYRQSAKEDNGENVSLSKLLAILVYERAQYEMANEQKEEIPEHLKAFFAMAISEIAEETVEHFVQVNGQYYFKTLGR